ncbi:MAG: hypothetical protein M3463_04360 [Verrucomicrobiota bacterium]|nr:hypothetical protein [Verrucomicrobiota bacterium]
MRAPLAHQTASARALALTYAIHMDRHTAIAYDRPDDQVWRARYGGNVTEEAVRRSR